MNVNRRRFLLFLGVGTASIALSIDGKSQIGSNQSSVRAYTSSKIAARANLSFEPVPIPLPLKIDSLTTPQQIESFTAYQVRDELVLPTGFTYDLIAMWGDRVGDSRFGYNNDYLSLVETAPNEGYLTVNFEYISGGTWMQTYPLVLGKQLPFSELIAATAPQSGEINAYALQDKDLLKTQIEQVSREGLIDLGLGVISVKRDRSGKWLRTYSPADRRVTGISGLDDPEKLLKSTGAAVAIFNKPDKLGYEDDLGDRIIGTFQNCAGGTTPWGTVLSAEENFQDQVPEAVMADGSSFPPQEKLFSINDDELKGQANIFGLAGNKYGWMVEIDPANPDDYGTKHTLLGRYRHEAFGIRAVAGQKLAVYSGCDRRGGHLYKFISSKDIEDPQDKSNSRLFESGILYGAKLYPNGIGEWIPLSPDTLVNPVLPSQVVGGKVMLPNYDRTMGGVQSVTSDRETQLLVSKFKTLGDLYQGDSPIETQGAILIDAHFAASAAGVTCTSRPEDTIVKSDGTLFVSFTSGVAGEGGGPDKTIFVGPNGESDYEYGWIMKLQEDDNDPAALNFTWSMLATGGEPATGGGGFANPDNLTLDRSENLWMVTDIFTAGQNQPVPMRSTWVFPNQNLTGVFGNNSLWYIPLSGDNAGQIYPFATGPMECECTGLTFDDDNSNLFLSIQHPGETNGIREDMNAESREFELLTTDGTVFKQQRQVPIGSNWPSKQINQPPIPGVVTIRRIDGREIV